MTVPACLVAVRLSGQSTMTAPDAPTIGAATGGDGQATVSFTPPADDGGALITGYTATSSPGGFTGTGAESPIVVTGLSNGTAYTFTVTATNGVGTGSASAASDPVTPTPTFTMVAGDFGQMLPETEFGFDLDLAIGSISPATLLGATIDIISTESDGGDPPAFITFVRLENPGYPFSQDFFATITIGAVTLNTNDATSFTNSNIWRWDGANLIPAAGEYTVAIA